MIFWETVRYGCVGGLSTVLHFCTVLALAGSGMDPLAANAVAFAATFQVSYLGHRHWTFAAPGNGTGYLRMLLVSLLAFGANETLYALLLKTGALDYRAALLVVLAMVGGGTYLASRCWVFRRARKLSN